jgi:transposase-like protein
MSITYPHRAGDVDGRPPVARPDLAPLAPHEQVALLSRIAERLPTDASAYEYLEQRRWRGSPSCPHCSFVGTHVFLRPANGLSRRTNRGKYSERRVWKCRSCKRQFSVITGTVMHGTHVAIRTWVLVAFEIAADGRGPTERDVARRYGLSTKSAHFLLRRIRDDLSRPASESLFAAITRDEPIALEPSMPPAPPIPNGATVYARHQEESDSRVVVW